MLLILIIPILVSGFIILNKSPIHKYKLHRFEGQFLYLEAARLGLYTLFWTVILAFTVKIITFGCIPVVTWVASKIIFSDDATSSRLVAWIILLSIFSVVNANLYCRFLNKQIARIGIEFHEKYTETMKEKGQKSIRDVNFFITSIHLTLLNSTLQEGGYNKLFLHALIHKKLIIITTDCRKVYVGYVSVCGSPTEKQAPNIELSIIPVLSGYRDKDTLNIIFTNDYQSFTVDNKMISTIIPYSEIIQASLFSMDIYKKVETNIANKKT